MPHLATPVRFGVHVGLCTVDEPSAPCWTATSRPGSEPTRSPPECASMCSALTGGHAYLLKPPASALTRRRPSPSQTGEDSEGKRCGSCHRCPARCRPPSAKSQRSPAWATAVRAHGPDAGGPRAQVPVPRGARPDARLWTLGRVHGFRPTECPRCPPSLLFPVSSHTRGGPSRTTEQFTGAESANPVLTPRNAHSPMCLNLLSSSHLWCSLPMFQNLPPLRPFPPLPPHPAPTLHRRVGTFCLPGSHRRRASSGRGPSPRPMKSGTSSACQSTCSVVFVWRG